MAAGASRARDFAPQSLTAAMTPVTVEVTTSIDELLDAGAIEAEGLEIRDFGMYVADLARQARRVGADDDLVASISRTLEAAQMSGTCSCGHVATMHDGPMNDGACTMEGCDCAAFDPAAGAGADEPDDGAGELSHGDFLDALERAMAETLSEEQAAQVEGRLTFHLERFELLDAPVDPSALPNGGLRWRALMIPEGTLTDDGRAFAPGSITWRELPLTLCAMLDSPHADVVTRAEACGRIDRIWREGNDVWGEGVFDTGEWGTKIAGLVSDLTLRGISVDVAAKDSEVGPSGDYFDEDGRWLSEKPAAAETDGDDFLDILFGDQQGIYVVTDGVIGTVTICPFPAFADAKIEIAASLVADGSPGVWTYSAQSGMVVVSDPSLDPAPADAEVLTASAAGLAPITPPAAWFANPELRELTPIEVTDDGRIFGHAGAWGVCHLGFPDECVTMPHSLTGNTLYHLGKTVCDDGTELATGKITMATGHAPRTLGYEDAASHYDNTGTVVADVVSGEDEFGIWVSGALRPNVDAERVRELRAATLSGDWRTVSGNLELVAILTVNVPGFPIPRIPLAQFTTGADGVEVLSLAAAGIHPDLVKDDRIGEEQAATLREQLRALSAAARGEFDLAAR